MECVSKLVTDKDLFKFSHNVFPCWWLFFSSSLSMRNITPRNFFPFTLQRITNILKASFKVPQKNNIKKLVYC